MIESAPWIRRIDIEVKADQLREKTGRASLPISPTIIARMLGIPLLEATFDDNSISGMLRRLDNGKYEILVNRRDPPLRMRYTVAHELGHFVLHRDLERSFVDTEMDFYRREADPEDPTAKRVEVQANMFAAALLMPRSILKEAYSISQDTAALAEMFLVSEVAMQFRIANLGLA